MVGVDAISGSASITPPAGTWNVISSDVAGSPASFEQVYYWHQVTSGDISTGSYTFTFDSSVQAAMIVAVYTHTCLDDFTPCSDPIGANHSSLPQNSGTISTGASGVTCPANSQSVAMFGHQSKGIPAPLELALENGDGVNGGLTLGDEPEPSGGTCGPFTATNSGNLSNIGQLAIITPE